MIVLPVTYRKIATLSVTTATQTALEFTGIPGTYDDLIVLGSIRTDRSGNVSDNLNVTINGSTSTFTRRNAFGNGSTVTAEEDSNGRITNAATAASATASTFGNFEIYFLNYTNSRNKSFFYSGVAENNATTGFNTTSINHWATGNAITSIKLESANSANIVQYSTLYLYGIKKS